MRHTIKKYFTGASIAALTLALNTSTSWAEGCTAVPTCDELGYNQTTCGDAPALKCPFDQTKLFCGGSSGGNNNWLTSCTIGDLIAKDGHALSFQEINAINPNSLPNPDTSNILGVCMGDFIITSYKEPITYSSSCQYGGSLATLPQLEAYRMTDINNFSKAESTYASRFSGLSHVAPNLLHGVWLYSDPLPPSNASGYNQSARKAVCLDCYYSSGGTLVQGNISIEQTSPNQVAARQICTLNLPIRLEI